MFSPIAEADFVPACGETGPGQAPRLVPVHAVRLIRARVPHD
ncbi:hypothetical protein [Natronospirillum operosum]|nr:hypothetical protein [Natronospirillum operosum]